MKIQYDDNVMFQECIEALQPNVTILSDSQTNKIIDEFEKKAPIYVGGSRIDWQKVDEKQYIDAPSDIIKSLKQIVPGSLDTAVYVFWNDGSLPVIKTNLESIVEVYDDVVSVGFETWIYNPNQGYVVENYYLGEIHAGLI